MSYKEFEETTLHILNKIKQGKIDSISLFNRLFLSYLDFIDNKLIDIQA